MKVLHLDTGREWRGGQQQVYYLTRGLEERGSVSVAAAPEGSPLAIRLRAAGLPLIPLPPVAYYSPRSIRSLQKILADRNWDVLHAHTSQAHTLVFLAFRLPPARPFHRPSFFISRRVELTPSRDPLTRLKFTTGGQTYICVSHAVSATLQTYGVPVSSLRVVHSGVPLPGGAENPSLPGEAAPPPAENDRRDVRAEFGIAGDALVIGNIAPLVESKGHRYLLESMPQVLQHEPRAHLLLLGAGELEPELRRLAAELSLEGHVTFAGEREDTARFHAAFDLFALASLEEGLGSAILEAQAAGLPVVATTAGGIPEAVVDGETGRLVRPADAEAFAHATLSLLMDQKLRLRLGRNARNWVEEHFSTSAMVEGTLAVYRDVSARA